MGAITISRWKAELAAGLVLAMVGGFFLVGGLKLPASDEPGVPGPGTAPMLLGGFIALCGLVNAVAAVLRSDRDPLELGNAKQWIGITSLVLGALLFEPLGFMLATFGFLLAGFMLLGDARWRRAVPAAAVATLSLWLIFTKLLGVGLPYGLISEALFR